MERETVAFIKKLMVWVVKNSERESVFKTPCPQWELNTHSLMDVLGAAAGMSEEEINSLLDENKDNDGEWSNGT